MMGKAHTAVLERAAQAAGGYCGDLILRQRYWIEKGAAGRFNDGVLRDWHYKKTPQTIWCVRRLTRAILKAPAEDESRIAFLLHWCSQYFVDAMCHVAQRVFTADFAAVITKMRGYDRSIEQDEQAGTLPAPFAVEDRDRQQATMYAWLKRWDVAIGK